MSPCLPLAATTTDRLAELLPALTHQANPVDTGRPGETFPEVLAAVGADPAIDLLAVYALLEPGAFDLTAAVGSAAGRLGPDGPPLVVATGGLPDAVAAARQALAAAGVAAYDGIAGAVTGVRALVDDARARAARADADPAVRLVVPEAFTLPVGEDEGKRLLTWLGIATPSRQACDDRADAHAALARLGGPVVVKMLEPVVLHKARVGGVRLGVRTGDDLDAALDALDAAGARRYLVEETAPPGPRPHRRRPARPRLRAGRAPGPGRRSGRGTRDGRRAAGPAQRGRLRRGCSTRFSATAGTPLDRIASTGPRSPPPSHPSVRSSAAVPELSEIEINPLRATVDGRLVALDVVVGGVAEAGTVDDAHSPALAALVDGPRGLGGAPPTKAAGAARNGGH